jgi:transcriptional regulator with XRE-family HTH domain
MAGMLTAEQLRAARAILQMDQSELALASGVSVETIKRLERQFGKLHAKVETIAAIRKALEERHLEFLGDQEGRGFGVCLVYRDKLQVLRETLIREWTDMMSAWLQAQCSSDPKFFEQDERRLTQTLIDQCARVLPAIIGRMRQENTVLPPVALTGPVTYFPLSYHKPAASRSSVSTESTTAERAVADAKCITATMLELIDDPTNLNGFRNLAFRRAFVAAIPVSERQGITITELEEPLLSAEGLARTTTAILTRVYGNADLMAHISETADDELTSIRDGLLLVTGRWAKFRAAIEAGDIREEFDLTLELMEAIKRTVALRSRGEKLHDYLEQSGSVDNLEDAVESLMRMFYIAPDNLSAVQNVIALGLVKYVVQAGIMTNDQRLGTPEATSQNIKSSVLRSLNALPE